ncbi:MAG: phage holin family protein [Mycoplasmataceae bacterium]|nr:phage holin family protein [Bacilli bacterium]MBQ5500924.1 phage holin family protein [Mycoplasmataceae bacterium]
MKEYYEIMVHNKGVQLLVIFIVLDVIFGVLRAIKEGKLNSTIGIDGIIRKVGMIITICVCILVDIIVSIDLIGFIPENVKSVLGLSKIGVSIIFNILYIIFEILSIFKNMYRCKLPLPKKLKTYLEKMLKEFTSEIKEGE